MLASVLSNFIFPKYCYGCEKEGSYLCRECVKNLSINLVQRCHICGKESRIGFVHKECSENTHLDGLLFFTLYEGVVEDIMHDIKYNSYFAITEDLGRIMAKYFSSYKLQNIVLTSVPIHSKKHRSRGFNQAELLGKNIAKNLGLEYAELIKRVIQTKTQVGLTKTEREINLKNAFTINGDLTSSKEKSVVIIDDIFTTGSTLNECAKVLRAEGFQKIYGFTFAKSRL